MKKIFYTVLCLALIMVSGCSEKKEKTNFTDNTNENLEISMSESDQDVQVDEDAVIVSDVSAVARAYFLEPFDDYSWEREFPVEKVVVHFTSAVVNYPEDPYNMDLIRNIFVDSGLSVHYIIDRDGTVYCYMPESRAAWHAGVGTYGNDEKYTNSMNKFSVGIELVAIGSENDMSQYLHKEQYDALDSSLIGFTDAQYEALSGLVKDICQRNNIEFSRENVLGHNEYNPAKSDPGELFDWGRLFD